MVSSTAQIGWILLTVKKVLAIFVIKKNWCALRARKIYDKNLKEETS
jgi:hypothetical protein